LGEAVRRYNAESWPRVGAVVFVLVLGTACGNGETGNGDDAQASARELPRAVCERLDRLDQQEEALEAPEVYALDEASVAQVLAGRREVLTELAAATQGELRALLEGRALAQPAVDEAMLDTWDEDRARLVEEHDDAWLDTVVGHELTLEDGEEIDLTWYWRTTQAGYERLVVGCRAPELGDGPEQETSQDPPPGRLVVYRPTHTDTGGEGGHIVVTTEHGTNEHELEMSEIPGASDNPRRWAATGWLDSSPAPNHHLLVNARAGDEYAMVEVSLDGTIVDFVQRSRDGPIMCPGWDTEGERVLALYDSTHATERHVLLLDLTRAAPSGPAPLPFATAGCSDFVTDDRIVVSDAALDIDDERSVWTVGVDGSDPRELYRPTADDCTTQVGSVDPGATRVALAQTCDDPLGSGIVVVDLASGESQRVVTGFAALPKWSPDGEWLVFGYAPLGEGPELGTWMARPGGRQLRQVLESPAWFPVWLPP
jgi:hypothetical protein